MISRSSLLASIAAASIACLAAPAHATMIRVDFNGTFTSTSDATGAVFNNGTGANSGVGSAVFGYALWDLSKPGLLGPDGSGTFNAYDYDQNGCYCNPANDAIRTWINIGGTEYAPDLNMGTYNTATIKDRADGDAWSQQLFSSGHDPVSPEVNGTFDYLSVDRRFGFRFADSSGMTLSGVDFGQPFEWLAGVNGVGGGSFSFVSQLFTGGTAERYSGTAGDYLVNASGDFSLSSLRVSQVPEPGMLALCLAAGVMLLTFGRRRMAEPTVGS
jgi:hypothetical protein